MLTGLPRSLPTAHTKATLKKIVDHNYVRDLQFLVNGSYSDGASPDEWSFTQWQNPWTGSEYYFAAQLLAEGEIADGLSIVDDVFDRHDREGMRFNHTECSEYYARALSIYATYDAWLGVDFDVPNQHLKLAPKQWNENFRCPLVLPAFWGELVCEAGKLTIQVHGGNAQLSRLTIEGGVGLDHSFGSSIELKEGAVVEVSL